MRPSLPMIADMVGHWFHWAADFATTWLPLAFFVVIGLTAWLLWRTAGMMPRVKPANMSHGAKSTTSWADVAGVEEVRRELAPRACTVLDAPDEVRDRIDVWGPDPSGLALTRRLKERFDPAGVCNPGRFVGGI